jgi:hypothetical protein
MDQQCQAPGCTTTTLCDARIVPAGFARTLSQPGGYNRAIRATGSKRAKQPHGEFDPAILCKDCDQVLGRFDEYAIGFCAALPQTLHRQSNIFSFAPFDGPQFARAILTILWRASISARDQFRDIDIGSYRDGAARILFEEAPLSSLPGFEVVLFRYASPDHDARKFVFMPLRIRSGDINAVTMGVGGFLAWAKLDQRRIDPQLAPYVINSAIKLRAPIIPFEDTAEYRYFQNVARLDRPRCATRRLLTHAAASSAVSSLKEKRIATHTLSLRGPRDSSSVNRLSS